MAEKGQSVLIVDDDETLAALMERILSRAGYEVSVASSVESALFVHEAEDFDLVMLDVFMPGIGGLDGIAEFASWGWTMPIISMSAGYGDMEPSMVLRAANKAGAAGVLAKPVTAQVSDFAGAADWVSRGRFCGFEALTA